MLIEPKKADEVNTETVQAKKRAAMRWCQYANDHAKEVGGKPWRYLLIPHNEILPNASVEGLVGRFS